MTKEAFSPAGKSAAEISKGVTEILVLSEADVMTCIDLSQLLDVLEDGFKALSQSKVVNPPRPQLDIPGAGYSLAMPAWMEGMNLTVKIVNVFEGNLAIGLPSHLATISLFDPLSGLPVCIMDGTFITAVRTSGSAVLSVRALARRDAKIATVVGAGVQANQHLHLLPLVRDFAEIRVTSKSFDDAAALARLHPSVVAVADLEAAVRSSDVVCLATHSYEPVIKADWVRPGTHVLSVGVAPPDGEMPIELIGKSSLFVETKDAFKPTRSVLASLPASTRISAPSLAPCCSTARPVAFRIDRSPPTRRWALPWKTWSPPISPIVAPGVCARESSSCCRRVPRARRDRRC
ncbi:ornithine cyclodeaminase family protein [Mesorhizobium delmotii]|uniref:Putative Ornithine cyclodeaminase 1 n=1 Tax=Mesorhizobium delmotii TaxID=1631247 RepID=A0A2P9AHW5_9HYPH|nr:putative Ornithine cyclodeaminase 1 [Mesorhizobium delmotii]